MKTIYTITILVFVSMMAEAKADKIETTARISSVTIYNSSAEIKYYQDVSLAPGKTTIIFTDLTRYIVDNTIKVSVSNPEVSIIKVTEKINFMKEGKLNNQHIASLKDSVVSITRKLGLLQCRIDVVSLEKGKLFHNESIGGLSKEVTVAEIEKASKFFNKRYYALSKELFLLKEKDKKLSTNIARYRRQIKQSSSRTMKATSEILVTVLNKSPRKVRFEFKFLTKKGGWAPAYDFRYRGPEVPLDFVFRANVFNASGVNWDNVKIKLSTANPTQGFNTPSLTASINNSVDEFAKVRIKVIEVVNAIAEYDIKHNYTIPSDSKPYLVDVNTYKIEADYNYLLIPKLDPFGFLMARIPNWNKYNLIPGTTNIYNKGSYMGKTFLNTYAENDTLSLFLGKDKNVRAVKKEDTKYNERGLIGNYYVDKAGIKIVVQNYSKEKCTVEVIDQVPIFDEKDKVKFNIQGIEAAIYNKRDGMLSWRFSIEPNSKKTINYKFKSKTPKDGINGIYDYRPKRRRFRTISCPAF